MFWICSHCNRGQCYWSPACRTEARLRQHRAANCRHQQSLEGRLDHRDRQRAYRLRFGTRKSQVQILPPRPPSNKIVRVFDDCIHNTDFQRGFSTAYLGYPVIASKHFRVSTVLSGGPPVTPPEHKQEATGDQNESRSAYARRIHDDGSIFATCGVIVIAEQ